MQTTTAARLRPAIALTLGLVAATACGSRTEYPLTQRQTAFSSMNEARVGVAPPVTAGGTSERIARAGSEPQNRRTYYGGYHGDRFSSLAQVNTGDVRSLGTARMF